MCSRYVLQNMRTSIITGPQRALCSRCCSCWSCLPPQPAQMQLSYSRHGHVEPRAASLQDNTSMEAEVYVWRPEKVSVRHHIAAAVQQTSPSAAVKVDVLHALAADAPAAWNLGLRGIPANTPGGLPADVAGLPSSAMLFRATIGHTHDLTILLAWMTGVLKRV